MAAASLLGYFWHLSSVSDLASWVAAAFPYSRCGQQYVCVCVCMQRVFHCLVMTSGADERWLTNAWLRHGTNSLQEMHDQRLSCMRSVCQNCCPQQLAFMLLSQIQNISNIWKNHIKRKQ